MPAPEDPPGFVVRTEAQKAASDNGFRIERGVESGGWLRYGSTTAHGEIWIAGASPRGPWLLSIDHQGVAAELATLPASPAAAPGLATFEFASLTALHAALDRFYKLGVSLPDAPLARFRTRVTTLLGRFRPLQGDFWPLFVQCGRDTQVSDPARIFYNFQGNFEHPAACPGSPPSRRRRFWLTAMPSTPPTAD
jgi:hypothetical protein